MKKKLLMLLGIHILSNMNLFSDTITCSNPDKTLLEFRVSYYYPNSSELRKIFNNGGINYQLTGTIPICPNFQGLTRGVNLWTGVDYFSKTGHSIGFDEKAKITIIPITVGIKYFFPFFGCRLPGNFYAAGGMKYYFLYTHNHSNKIRRNINRRGMGSIAEIGFITNIENNLIIDIFGSYSSKSFGAPSISNPAIEGISLNVSGFNIGAGIGYKF